MPANSRRFRFMWNYLRGYTPWESGIVPPEIIAWIESAESEGIGPGRALDLGCGTGTTSLYLAARGWEVAGVDFANNAIWQARKRAREQQLDHRAHFYTGNVTRLEFLPGDPPFDLVIDIGCLHSLTEGERSTYAENLARLTRPGAAFLLYSFMPRADGRGIDATGLEDLFHPAFDLVDMTLGQDSANPKPSGWYTLRRTALSRPDRSS